MNSENPPAIYTLAALRALPEWKESGRVLNLSTVEDPEFQDRRSSPGGAGEGYHQDRCPGRWQNRAPGLRGMRHPGPQYPVCGAQL